MIYDAVNQTVLARIPKNTVRLLDLGCGSGALGEQIKKNINCEVIGVTSSEAEAVIAAKCIDKVIVKNLNSLDLSELGKFDCIVCSHILEHLYYPDKLLLNLHKNLLPGGIIIIALPNVLHWKQRFEFLKGNFRYSDGGLMDRTHFRFFDWKSAQDLFKENGYKIIERSVDGHFPLFLLRKLLPSKISLVFDKIAVKLSPGLFGVQFIFICRSDKQGESGLYIRSHYYTGKNQY